MDGGFVNRLYYGSTHTFHGSDGTVDIGSELVSILYNRKIYYLKQIYIVFCRARFVPLIVLIACLIVLRASKFCLNPIKTNIFFINIIFS